MARYKKKWLASLPIQPCARCGYVETTDGITPPHQGSYEQPANTFTYAGPSARFERRDLLTPESPDSTMEEGLIGSGYRAGYGSISRPEPTLHQPEEVMVGKGKKKASSGVVGKGSNKSATV